MSVQSRVADEITWGAVMQLGPALDTAIGLVLVYLMLSLVLTTSMEIAAAVLNARGTALAKAIDTLTSGLPAIKDADNKPIVETVSQHPLILGAAAKSAKPRPPSYVDAVSFAKAVLDHLGAYDAAATTAGIQNAVNETKNDTLIRTLTPLIQGAGGKIATLEAHVADWFDKTMDRVSGEYKRRNQLWSLLVGVLIAVAFNASSLAIGQQLWTDDNARAAMVQASSAQRMPTTADAKEAGEALSDFRKARDKVAQLPLPLGWSQSDVDGVTQHFVSVHTLLLVAGWLMTGLALSLGAPFWFDCLQNLMNLRNTGPKPDGSKRSG
jgi:hypothetical protein